ncbi:type II toxin-antitoxin system RelE/ParE family toxin [Nitrospirillum viridazoti]|uniref:Toxin n=1 Tax=Nitrospirillum viridazoti CBAmc TaxID=1441467 RepID=A0A248JM27_9PROT|nr:type II toxin-antitoxin system RelE/ParE family toxin [Nitrospirillum amazonense]ASG19520.1 plasmid stabilization system protein [Nitrospirillum amazonense CBAmc]
MTIRLTRRADADLLDIAEYTADRWGDAQADVYTRAFAKAFQRLDENPRMLGSRARDDLGRGYRTLLVEQHLVIYRHRAGTTHIMRVLHQRMNLPLHRLS